jgi:hypothetical protein
LARNGGSYNLLYEAVNNTLYQRASATLPVVNDRQYSYRVTYNPTTGRIDLWRDEAPVLSWTDATPLTAGAYVALRANPSEARIDDVRVGSGPEYDNGVPQRENQTSFAS